MKHSIYKYPVTPDCTIALPRGAKVLTVQAQYGEPQLWALVDTQAPSEMRRFRIFGTGERLDPQGLAYIATFQMHGGSFIFHVFEDMSEEGQR